MSTITVEIPKWAEERDIVVLAGMELLAIRKYGQPLKVKVVRCQRCGICCMNMTVPEWVGESGWCKYLSKEGDIFSCELRFNKPYSCLMDPVNVPECAVRLSK